MKRLKTILLFTITCVLLVSCHGYEDLLRSNDYDAKYKAAIEYYDKEDYNRAGRLFENLQMYYRGQDLSEDITWRYAQCLLKQDDHYGAAYQLVNFTRRFPFSKHAEDASYLAAYCQYHESLEYSLDQSQTKGAITAFESFAEHYPNSPHMPQVNEFLDQLRNKLMRKEYEIAYGWYKVEQYHAAYVSLNDFLNHYPESPYREDAMFYILRSGYEFGINSREDKIKERLQLVVNDFDKFATTFTDSKYLTEAQKIYTDSKAKLAELEAQNNENERK